MGKIKVALFRERRRSSLPILRTPTTRPPFEKNVRAQTSSSRKDDDDDDDDDGAESARTIFYRGPKGGHAHQPGTLFLGKTRNDCDDSVRRRGCRGDADGAEHRGRGETRRCVESRESK